jgi:hypothetical protein
VQGDRGGRRGIEGAAVWREDGRIHEEEMMD